MKLMSLLVLLAPAMTSCKPLILPENCADIHNADSSLHSGVYTIYPIGSTSAVQVYCDMDTEGGGWTVFQRRMDGTVNFYRPWDQYKVGFGVAAGEYWLGLENLHHMTKEKRFELRVDMEDFEGNKVYSHYSSFRVGSESDEYVLEVSDFRDGGAGDSMTPHNGHKFSTLDKDQDTWNDHCARKFLGAFWYNDCHTTNPNGIYRWGHDASLFAVGVSWYTWKGHDYSLKGISMKIRPVS
ncbi:microfibril-associated glycoprotein 4-like [Nelusetta ayraudi]|uniref:microfibril-associated glycoprotein 4-like n=1 Tax=Nelusetta ayraudi TaxID=303726 RepID=UPI003F6E67EC